MGSTGADEESWRAALSALLDGEEPPVPMAAIVTHLAQCAPCSEWLHHATTLDLDLRTLPMLESTLGERIVNSVDLHLCGCRAGDACLCTDCQCGPLCTCHTA